MLIFQSVKLIVIKRRSVRVSEAYSLHTKKCAFFYPWNKVFYSKRNSWLKSLLETSIW